MSTTLAALPSVYSLAKDGYTGVNMDQKCKPGHSPLNSYWVAIVVDMSERQIDSMLIKGTS